MAIAATASPLHKHIDLRQTVAVEVGHLGTHHLALHGLADRLDGGLGTIGGDRELLLRALSGRFHLEADALKLQRSLEGRPSQGGTGDRGGQDKGGRGDGCGWDAGQRRVSRLASALGKVEFSLSTSPSTSTANLRSGDSGAA